MITRLLFAVVGAVAITIGLLLFMDDVTGRYLLRDPTQYFRITDYFSAPDRGRQLPDVPVVPEIAPERPQFEYPQEEDQPADDEPPPGELPREPTGQQESVSLALSRV